MAAMSRLKRALYAGTSSCLMCCCSMPEGRSWSTNVDDNCDGAPPDRDDPLYVY
jgi:hypothetical protein